MFQFLLPLLLISFSSHNVFAGPLMRSAVESYSSWKNTHELTAKDCEGDAKNLSSLEKGPKTMTASGINGLRWSYIPTNLVFEDKLDSSTLQTLRQIDKLAKDKALAIFKVNKKVPLEVALKSKGLALVTDANLTPEDFLKSFNYFKACECLHSTKLVVPSEAEYNKLSVQDFLILEENHKVKCFVNNATI